LDGDNVRHGLSSNLGFSKDDRRENVRRIGEAAKLMMEAGVIVLTAFISPFRADREAVRNLMRNGDFFEIYCKASLETCESRDVKGLYKKARAGEIKNYTGIDSPYEAPEKPELTIDTDELTIEDSAQVVINFLIARSIIR
jgi:adenylylsulfate kinase